MFDAGPKSSLVLEYYKKNINLADIDLVFITHAHVDHYGDL